MERKTEEPAIECEIPEAIKEACKAAHLDIVRAKLVLPYRQLDGFVGEDGVLFERTIAIVDNTPCYVRQIDEKDLETLGIRLRHLSEPIRDNGLDVKLFDNCWGEKQIRDNDTFGFWNDYERRYFSDRRDKYTLPQFSAFERVGERTEEHRVLVSYEESQIREIKDELKARGCPRVAKEFRDKEEKITKVPITIRNRLVLYPDSMFNRLTEIYEKEASEGCYLVQRDLGGSDRSVDVAAFDEFGFCEYLDVKAFPGFFPDGRILSEQEKKMKEGRK